MEKAVNVAVCIYKVYHNKFNKGVTEMTLHQLLYLVQKEYLRRKKEPMFDDTIRAWIHGPVVLCVRTAFKKKLFLVASDKYQDVSRDAFIHITRIVDKYGLIEPWVLSDMIKNNYAWSYTRNNRAENDESPVITNEIILEEIKHDNFNRNKHVTRSNKVPKPNHSKKPMSLKHETKKRHNPIDNKKEEQYNQDKDNTNRTICDKKHQMQKEKSTEKELHKQPYNKNIGYNKPTSNITNTSVNIERSNNCMTSKSLYNSKPTNGGLSDDQITKIMKQIDKENSCYNKSKYGRKCRTRRRK